MDITVTCDLVIPGAGSFKPGDKITVNEGTGKSLVESRMALEGHVTKTVLNKELKARAALRDVPVAQDQDTTEVSGDGNDDADDA